MKARLLTKILNNTGYTVNNNENYIAVGSPYCHDLISVDKKTLKVKYALDTWHEGRKALEGRENSKGECELLFIWDKLHELISNGEIYDIINGNDKIENPLPVFTCDDGKLIETFTDEYGYPNTTISGEVMYENTYFKTRDAAIKYGIEDCNYAIKSYERREEELISKLEEVRGELVKYRQLVVELQSL